MKNDITIPEVKNVYVAAFQTEDAEWKVCLINDTNVPLENVIVNSRGYGDLQNKSGIQTSSIKRIFKVVPAKQAIVIEQIMPNVFHLFNEYWVTYFEENQMKDRQFIFGPGTIDAKFEESLPIIGAKGILIR